MGCLDGSWTNEKHISFLNWMEASFVKRMLKNDDFVDGDARLDRYLPDSAESTLDFDCGRSRRRVHGKRGNVFFYDMGFLGFCSHFFFFFVFSF